MKEDAHQAAYAKWMAYAYPSVLWWHTPNGGSRDKREAAKLSAMGTRRGVPDILVLHRVGDSPGLAIELKVGRNKATSEQREILQKLCDQGWAAFTLYGWEAAKQVTIWYLDGVPIDMEKLEKL